MLDYDKWMQEQVGTWKEKKDQTGTTENASQHSALQGWETAPASCRFPPAATETVLRKQISHILPWVPTVLFPRGVPKCYLSLVPSQLPAITFGKDFSCSVRKQWEWEKWQRADEGSPTGMAPMMDAVPQGQPMVQVPEDVWVGRGSSATPGVPQERVAAAEWGRSSCKGKCGTILSPTFHQQKPFL